MQSPAPANWKRAAGWGAIALLVLVVASVALAVVLFHSEAFKNYLLKKVQQIAAESLNTPVRIQNLAIHFSPLSADLYGVTVRGTEPETEPPLLTVDHIKVGFKIVSFVRRKWNLNDIEIDRPVAHFLLNQQGENNLPARKTTGTSRTNIFDLAIQHARLERGELYYNDKKSIIDADLRDLTFRSAYDGAQGGRYQGALGYRDGRFVYDHFAPMPHNLEVGFDATRSALALSPATLSLAGSQLRLQATVHNYSSPVVDLKYDSTIQAGEFRAMLRNSNVPAGVVRIAGSAHYEYVPNRPLIESLSAEGDISSRSLLVQTSAARSEVRDAGSRFQLRDGNLSLSEIRLYVLGGEVRGNASIQDLAGRQLGQFSASARGLSLESLQSIVKVTALDQVRFGGAIDADTKATWVGAAQNLVADTDATIHASVASRGTTPAAASPSVPLDGEIHARYSANSQQISLSRSSLRTPQTTLTMDGVIGGRSNLQVTLQANALHEVETLAEMFRVAPPGRQISPLELYGAALFRGNIRGTLQDPQLSGQLTARDLRVRGSQFRLLRTDIAASSSQVSLQGAELDPASGGKLTFDLRTALRQWAYGPENSLAVSAHASRLSIAELAHIAGVQAPVTGILNADFVVKGSQANPIGSGKLSLTRAKAAGEPIQSLNAQFEGTGEAVNASIELRAPVGAASGKLTYDPRQQRYQFTLQAPHLLLNQLQSPRAKRLRISGQLSVSASGRGTLQNPELQVNASIPELQVHGQIIRDLKLDASAANHEAQFTLDAQAANTSVRGQGKVALKDNYYAVAQLDTQRIPLQPLFAAHLPAQAQAINGQTELHATLRGPLKDRQHLEAHLEIPVFHVSYESIELAASAPIRADYANGVFTLQPAEIKGTGTALRMQGDLPLVGSAPATLSVVGTADLRLLQILEPDLESHGQLQFDIRAQGNKSNPDVQGQIRIVDAGLVPSGLPSGLQHANGVLTLQNKRLDIAQLQGQIGGGNVTARGGIAYGETIRIDLAAAVNQAQFVSQGLRITLDGNLALTGTPQAAVLSGQVNVGRVTAAPDFDLNNLLDAGAQGEVATPPGTGLAQNIKLNVGIQTTSPVKLVSRTLSIQGSANLRATGNLADPVILGRVNITGGDVIAYGNRYILQPGTMDFINPVQTEPVVNLAATTSISQYSINLRMQGPLERLRTTYSSDPALPPVDIINLLAFGQTTEAAGANPTPGTLGAESVLASGISGKLTSRIQNIAGISRLSIDPVLGSTGSGSQQNPGAHITVQQRVTSNLFVTFASDVTSTQNQIIQVEYHFSPRWSFSGVRDQNGGFGFDFRLHKEY
jgi:translocation and assembly module TamB